MKLSTLTMAVSFMKITFTNHWRNALTTYFVSCTVGARQGWFHNLWVQVSNKLWSCLFKKQEENVIQGTNIDNSFLPLSFLICPGVFYLLFDVVLPQAMGYSTSWATSLPTGSLSQPTMDRPLQGIFFLNSLEEEVYLWMCRKHGEGPWTGQQRGSGWGLKTDAPRQS